MRSAAAAALLLGCAVLQVTWAPNFALAGVFPNLVLLIVVGWTLTCGAAAGLRWAVGGGLLLDLVSPGPLGVHALALVTAAYGAGFAPRAFANDALLLPAATGAAATVVYNLVLLALADTFGQHVALVAVLQAWVAPAALLQGILTPFACWPLRRLDARAPAPVRIEW